MADSARGVQAVRGKQELTVRESITVERPLEDAFRLFTDGMEEWWPLKGTNFSYGGDRADKIFLEAKLGGRLYERFTDGQEFEIGRVTACEAPHRIVFSWNNPGWNAPTEVEVRFTPAGNGTRVELEHRGWEAAGKEAMESAPGWGEGWKFILARFGQTGSQPLGA